MKALLLIDNQEITRLGLRTLANDAKSFSKIVEVTDPGQLVPLITHYPDAVVAIDYMLTDLSADRLLALRDRFPTIGWLIFSETLNDSFIRRMTQDSKAFSFVTKSATIYELRQALKTMVEGKQYLCDRAKQTVRKSLLPTAMMTALTPTETEILRLIALGKTTKEIAAERYLSVHTVKTHRKNLSRKINVNNIYEATKYALCCGIIQNTEYYI